MRHHLGETIALPVPQGAGGAASATLWGVEAGDTLTAQAQDGAATFTATETANLLPGRYLVQWTFTGTEGQVRIVDAPAIVVLAVAEGQPPTPTDAESRLEAAERLLDAASGSAELSLSTADGTSMTFETRADLLAYVARLRDEVGVERAARALQGGPLIG